MTGLPQKVPAGEVEVLVPQLGGGRPAQTAKKPVRRPRQKGIVHVGWDAKTGRWAQYAPVTTYLQALAAGNYLQASAKLAGISPASAQSWLDKGYALAQEVTGDNEPDSVGIEKWRKKAPTVERAFIDFWAAHEKAVASAEVFLVTHWKRAAAEDWRAAAELLRRRHPERWRVRDEIGIKVEDDRGPSPIEIALRNPELALRLQQVAYDLAELNGTPAD